MSAIFLSILIIRMIYFRRCPRVLDDPSLGNITTLTLLLLVSQNYVKNPYLLAKLVEVRKKLVTRL